jgi:hypothetical protein
MARQKISESSDQNAGRQIELATDHQHADGYGDDADCRGLVKHGEEGWRRTEGGRHDQEEDEDHDGGHQGPDFWPGQQAIGQAERDAVRRLRWRRRRRSFDSLTHGDAPLCRATEPTGPLNPSRSNED